MRFVAGGYDERAEAKPGKKNDADRGKVHCGWSMARLDGLLDDCGYKSEEDAPPGFAWLPRSGDPAPDPCVSSVHGLVAPGTPGRALCADGAGFPGGGDSADVCGAGLRYMGAGPSRPELVGRSPHRLGPRTDPLGPVCSNPTSDLHRNAGGLSGHPSSSAAGMPCSAPDWRRSGFGSRRGERRRCSCVSSERDSKSSAAAPASSSHGFPEARLRHRRLRLPRRRGAVCGQR